MTYEKLKIHDSGALFIRRPLRSRWTFINFPSETYWWRHRDYFQVYFYEGHQNKSMIVWSLLFPKEQIWNYTAVYSHNNPHNWCKLGIIL